MFATAYDEKSKSETKNKNRRTKRQMRRQLRRKKSRKRTVLEILHRHGIADTADRHKMKASHPNLFALRAEALERPLSRNEMAQIVYVLAGHRGMSDRYEIKEKKGKEDKEKKKAAGGILRNRDLLKECGFRTFGEAKFKTVSLESGKRYRNGPGDYSNSYDFSMTRQELEEIVRAQAQMQSPALLGIDHEALLEELCETIFFQRPLKSTEEMVGFCSVEYHKGVKCAAKCSYAFFRYALQLQYHNIRLVRKATGEIVSIPEIEGAADADIFVAGAIANAGSGSRELSITKLSELLGLPRGSYEYATGRNNKPVKLKIETGAIKLYAALDDGKRGHDEIVSLMDDGGTESLSFKLSCLQSEEQRYDFLMGKGLEEEEARQIAPMEFGGFGSYGIPIMREISEKISAGMTPSEAKDAVGAAGTGGGCNWNFLPPLEMDRKYIEEVLPRFVPGFDKDNFIPFYDNMVNPTARRVIAELRKVVNHVLQNYGKPDRIVIETARETNSVKKQDEISRAQEKRKKVNEALMKKAGKIPGFNALSPDKALRRYRLWKEQKGRCLYCGEAIPEEKIFSGDFEVDHVVPRSRLYMDKGKNIVLVHASDNQAKGNLYHHDYLKNTGKWDNFCSFVEGTYQWKTKKEWLLEENFEERLKGILPDRYLNDTRYAGSLAAKYLSYYLYPREGRHNKGGERPIFNINGTGSWILRESWGLEKKSRDNHYHHFIDAITLSLATPSTIKRLFEHIKVQEKGKKDTFHCPIPEYPKFIKKIEEEYRSGKRYVKHSRRYNFNQEVHDEKPVSCYRVNEKGECDKNAPISSDAHLLKRISIDVAYGIGALGLNQDKGAKEDQRRKAALAMDEKEMLAKAEAFSERAIVDTSPDRFAKRAFIEYAKRRFEADRVIAELDEEIAKKKNKNDEAEKEELETKKKRIEEEMEKTLPFGHFTMVRGRKGKKETIKRITVRDVNGSGTATKLGNHLLIRDHIFNKNNLFCIDVYRDRKSGRVLMAPQYGPHVAGKNAKRNTTRVMGKSPKPVDLSDTKKYTFLCTIRHGNGIEIEHVKFGTVRGIFRGADVSSSSNAKLAHYNTREEKRLNFQTGTVAFNKIDIGLDGEIVYLFREKKLYEDNAEISSGPKRGKGEFYDDDTLDAFRKGVLF
ncbi:type II CRISPR RNA-guided endonuclease Cas9 [Hydrogenimonas sp.]